MAREPYVKIQEAAKFLGLSRRSLDGFVADTKAGIMRFPFYQDKPNGRLYFKLSELELWRFDNKKS
ncbi:MAG: helix-turn-helix domain-containing protein [Candidatus Scalindua sp. AMX11]|nr:MAG: helix-turn-helix domain-containing protein [Candidatus Scalindua sp.]NOG83801.1 helix-turn-helix domain-containing protein [Planctomycetota bacterium]RZV82957.1 MAG: helix-turn-helix domain-containing protein [Candidatus Scalindua sp. SCAELEC01]TDE64421.1 MAG: helix-turn-helix domain-containing protein [Candidatus Scalindua sp. AMX11]GJQ59748.1 MAG: hypothetical protein SCALA701_25490 [Candidatus Scalindua sp.]